MNYDCIYLKRDKNEQQERGRERERERERYKELRQYVVEVWLLASIQNNLRLLVHWEAHFGSRLVIGEKQDQLCLQIDALS